MECDHYSPVLWAKSNEQFCLLLLFITNYGTKLSNIGQIIYFSLNLRILHGKSK